ncbi:MAG: tetratricopeptide repeat protein [bacterium]|nr:tetratricopeptide repeat protein [bacterium]
MKNRLLKYNITGICKYLLVLNLLFCFSLGCSDLPEDRKIRVYSTEIPEEVIPEVESFLITGLPQQRRGPSVLVLPFTDVTPDAEGKLSGSAAEIITFLMRQHPNLNVYYMEELFPLQDLSDGMVTETALARILERDLLDYYIEGTVTEQITEFTINYSIIDAKSQATTKEEEITKSREELVGIINEAGSGIYNTLLSESENEFIPINTNFTAYGNFVKGIRAEESYDILTAMGYYIECLVDDNSFGKVYDRIISLYFKNEEFFEQVDIQFFLREASNYRDQLNDNEKLTLSAYSNFYYGKYDEAISTFRSLVDLDDNDPEGYIGLVKVYLELSQPENALETASTYPNTPVRDVYLLKLQSRAYSMIDKFDEALELIDSYIDIDSMNTIPLMEKSRLLYNWGREAEAVEVISRAINIDSSAIKPRLLLSSIFINSMEFHKNIDNLNTYIAQTELMEPEKMLEIMLNLFISYSYTGQYNLAIRIGNELMRIGASDRSLEYPLWLSAYIAYLHHELGHNEDIYATIEPYLEDNFRDPSVFTMLSIMSIDSGSDQLTGVLDGLYENFINRDRRRSDLFKSIKTGFDYCKNRNFSQAIIELNKIQEYEYNPLVGYYICMAYIELNDLSGCENEINSFYSNLALEKFETSIALPRFYHAQALLLEKKGMNESSSNIYSNLKNLWNLSDDEMNFKQQILNKIR